MKYLMQVIIISIFWGACQSSIPAKINRNSEEISISDEDRQKLFPFIKNREVLPFLDIDSLQAVDSLGVLPESFHFMKETLRWKKAYPAEDFLRLRAYVRSIGYLWVLTVDSLTAVDSLHVVPEAFTDLKENILDCNRIFGCEIWEIK